MKYNVSPAASTSSPVDLSQSHITTLDFGQVLPVSVFETLPRDNHSVDISSYIRLSPLVFPTFGQFDLTYSTFYIPYFQIWKYFDDFVSGSKSNGSVNLVHPYFSREAFVTSFSRSAYGRQTNKVSEADFSYVGASATSDSGTHYVFTTVGKYCYKVLQMLGYQIESGADMRPGSDYLNGPQISALPLLAYLKAYNDYMQLSVLYNSSQIDTLLQSAVNGGLVSFQTALDCLATCIPLIGSDYFTSSFDNINNPGSYSTTLTTPAIGTIDSLAKNPTLNSTTTDVSVSTSTTSLTSRQTDFLDAFTRFVRRNNLVGTRAAQRIFARFGVQSDDFYSNYCRHIQTSSMPFTVGDVTSTSPNENPQLGLGTYSGQCVASGHHKFQMDANDYGLCVTFAYITLRASYINPVHPRIYRSSYLDYYQPEFDGVGVQPISYTNLTNNPRFSDVTGASHAWQNQSNKVFGFVPRYEDYRTNFNFVTGDFTLFDSLDPWHFGRRFYDRLAAGTLSLAIKPQSVNFQGPSTEFDRIFMSDVVSNEGVTMYDHFFASFYIDHKGHRAMRSRAGSIDMQDGQLQLSSLGKTLNTP